jgi:nicotinate-nucleotide adenylyltransferase
VNVAVFGGSFNPVHVAHVLAVAYVLATEEVDELLVVPCFVHPFAKQLAPFEDRFAMCEEALAWLPRTRVSRVEQLLGGESRTLRTLEHLAAQRPDDSFRLVVGADLLLEGKRWHGFGEVLHMARPIVLGRVGVETGPRPLLPDVSSTAIREAIGAGRGDEVASLLPRGVARYIADKGLYRS